MAKISASACLVGCSVLLVALLIASPPALENAVVGSKPTMQEDESALIQKELSITIRAPDEQPEYETDDNGVMHMPDMAKVHYDKLPETPDELEAGQAQPDFADNIRVNEINEYKASLKRSPEEKEAYEKFIHTPNKPGHVHYAPGTLFIPEKDSAKMQHAFVKAGELAKKAKQVKNSVVKGLEKAEEMVMVSMPSLDEVSEEMVDEDKTDKYYDRGGSADSGRRRRVTLDEALPEWAKKRAAELPDKIMERRAKSEEGRQKARKVWDLQSTVGSAAAMEEVQAQAKDTVSKRVRSIGEVISKWTTTTTRAPEGSEAAPTVETSDKSGSSMASLATWLTLFLLVSAMYSSS